MSHCSECANLQAKIDLLKATLKKDDPAMLHAWQRDDDETEKLRRRVDFLEQHLEIVTSSLLDQIDKECLPKFEEARKTIMNMRESTARKR